MTSTHTAHPTQARIGLLQDKVAVITGAGRGIGATTAELFVEEGARVLVADISGSQADVAAELGSAAISCQVDLRQEDDIEAMFARAVEHFGRVDVFVNVAGNPGGRRSEEITLEEYDSITSIHLRGTMLTNKHAVRAMLAGGNGGAIVNFSSAASFNIDEKISFAYSAAKAGINSVTKSFAVHHGPRGTRTNAVAPGFTLSERNQAVPEDIRRALGLKALLGRAGTPVEQAQVAAFLASDRASSHESAAGVRTATRRRAVPRTQTSDTDPSTTNSQSQRTSECRHYSDLTPVLPGAIALAAL